MNDLVARLSSRKFWLTVCAAGTLIASGQYPEAVAVVIAFLGVEGAADAMSRRSEKFIKEFREALERESVE